MFVNIYKKVLLNGDSITTEVKFMGLFTYILRAIVNAPWYITNAIIHSDLGIPTV
jgi:hypothetical protein